MMVVVFGWRGGGVLLPGFVQLMLLRLRHFVSAIVPNIYTHKTLDSPTQGLGFRV